MSTINEALKRAARGAGAGQPAPPVPDDRFPEPLAEPAPSQAPAEPQAAPPQASAAGGESQTVAGPSCAPKKRPRLPRWLLVAIALLGAVVLYIRLVPRAEPGAALAQPAVYREKIVDERQSLMAELQLPEERVGDVVGFKPALGVKAKAAPTADEADEEALAPAPGRPKAAPGRAALKVPPTGRPALKAAAPADDDEEEDAAASRPRTRAEKARAARRSQAPPAAPAPPALPRQGGKPYGPLPASQFTYAGAPAPPVVRPASPAPRPVAAAAPAAAQPSPADLARDLLRQAIDKDREGKSDQAMALYSLVLERQPGREGPSLRYGNLLYRRQRYDEAVAVFQKAVATHQTAALRNNLGSVYLAQGKLDLARQEFQAAAGLDAKYADPHYNLACYFTRMGQKEEGLAELHKAKAIEPKVVEWAAEDGDLAPLRSMPEYKRLTE